MKYDYYYFFSSSSTSNEIMFPEKPFSLEEILS